MSSQAFAKPDPNCVNESAASQLYDQSQLPRYSVKNHSTFILWLIWVFLDHYHIMTPMRVGIIGLSSATTNLSASPGDGWAARLECSKSISVSELNNSISAHLPYLQTSKLFEIVALCNTSIESAKAAIKRHGLSTSTKAYGNPEDIANDPDIDLVVCCVRADRHYQATMPSLKVGKAVFVEWPLGANLEQGKEMLAAAKQSGSKTIVGLQGRSSPFTKKIKQLVESKAIGELLSSTMTLDLGFAADTEVPGVDYMAKKDSGANTLSIVFGHSADLIVYALGGIEEVSALLTTRWPVTKLLHSDGSFDKMIKRDTADHIMFHGTISGSGAPLSIYVRNGKGFKDVPNFSWRIFGTKGEICVTANAIPSLALGGEKIELYDHEKDAVEVVEVQYADVVKDLPTFAKNTALLYEGFANGADVAEGFVGFEEAVGMHKIIDAIEKSSEGKKYVKVDSPN
jgi:predicted dehydrogenase